MGKKLEVDIKLYLFGPPRLELNGNPAEFNSRRGIAAFAYLALTKRPHTRESLATLLWPEADPKNSRARLRRMLYDMDRVVGKGVVEKSADVVGLSNRANVWVDVYAFREAAGFVEKKKNIASDTLVENLEKAAGLAQGEFMQGFSLPDSLAFDEWQFYERESLRAMLDSILEGLAKHYQEIPNYQSAIQWSQRRLALDRLSEPAVRQLMSLLALAGLQSAALREYGILAQSLHDEYGLEPENETLQLYETIRKRQYASKAESESGSNSKTDSLDLPSGAPPHNLPARSSTFVGRVQDIHEISQLLTKNVRMLTLTGPGGVGKTQLALQTAYSILETEKAKHLFKDGVYFISLAPVPTGRGIASAAASVLNLSSFLDIVDAYAQLIASLHDRQLLLIFDNFEHLLEDKESVLLLSRILEAAPAVKILVTSRSRLYIHEEQVMQIGGLELPDKSFTLPDNGDISAYSAVKFFIECARRSQPSFTLSPESTPHVLNICRMVEGSPLGIELAAAWLPVLSPSEIAAEIEKGLDFLEADWRDVPDRQKSLRAVFNASWRTLTAKEQESLRYLSMFSGGFRRQGAEQICNVDLKDLLNLSGKSWITRQGPGRFQIHELLRQYAHEKLQEDQGAWTQAWERFCDYYANFLSQQGELMKGSRQGESFKAVKEEFLNIRLAWLKLVEQKDFEAIKKMQYGLVRESMSSGRAFEALSLLEGAHKRLLEAGHPDPILSAILQTPRLVTLTGLFLYDSLETPNDEDLETLREVWLQANSFTAEMGYWYILLTYQYGRSIDRLAAINKLDAILPGLKHSGKDWERAAALAAKASLLSLIGKFEDARKCLDTAISLQKKEGDHIQCALSLHLAGFISTREGNFQQGEIYLKEGLELVNRSGEVSFQLPLISTLGGLYLKKGQFEQAFYHMDLVGQIARKTANPFIEAAALSTYSFEAVRYGDMGLALEKRLYSIKLFESLNAPHYAAWGYWELGELHRVEGDLIEAERWYNSASAVFDELGITSGKAFYERGMGDLALMGGRYEEARRYFEKSLSLSFELLHEWLASYAMSGLGRAEAALGMPNEAQEHFIKAVKSAHQIGDRGLSLVGLAGLASLFLFRGRPKEAAILSTFITNHYASWRETRYQAKSIKEQALSAVRKTEIQKIEQEASLLEIPHLIEQFHAEVQISTKTP